MTTEAQRLGDAFADVLRDWLTPAEFAEMRALNATPRFQGDNAPCASHNYCDANMAMDAAFPIALGRELDLHHDEAGNESPDFALFNAAWDYAKAAHLTAPSWGSDALNSLVAEFATWTTSQGIGADEGDALELLMVDRPRRSANGCTTSLTVGMRRKPRPTRSRPQPTIGREIPTMTTQTEPTGAYAVEYTDTFGGEANYCWVQRANVAPPSAPWGSRAYRAQLTRRAKAAMGLTGWRGRMVEYSCGDFAFYPYGSATVMFCRWDDLASVDSEAGE